MILLGLTAFVVGVVGFFHILIYIGKVCVFVNVIFFFRLYKVRKVPYYTYYTYYTNFITN